MTNPYSEMEEGELMDQDPVLTTLEEMLKVSTFKNSFAIIHHQTINLQKIYLVGLLTLIILSNQTLAFDPKEQLFANTANNLRVAHYDCQLMTSNKMFSLNKVAPCKVQPENIKVAHAYVTLYQRHYRTKVNATMCRIKHQSMRWFCDSFDSSGIDARQNMITTDLHLSADQCKLAADRGYLNLGYASIGNIPFKFNVKTVTNAHAGKVDGKHHNECDGRSWIKLDTFETYMQNVTLTVNLKDGTVNNWQNIPLPCPVSTNGCETTSLDAFAYTWEEPNNCIFTVLNRFPAKMIQNEESYYIIKGDSSPSIHSTHTRDSQKFMLQVMNKPQSLCGHPRIVYPTSYDSLFIAYTDGFNMDTGIQVKPTPETGTIHNAGQPNSTFLTLSDDSPPLQFSSHQIDYEAHIGTKLDYILFYSFYMLRTAELALLQNQCELERSSILNTLMLSLESPRLAGYILTKNRSMFLETNGNVAWLYHCPKFYSPLQLMDECYNRIPIMYKENIRFVDPITRQTFQSADLQDCSDKHSNLFQLDVDDDKSWIELTPQITRVTGPYLFEPKEIIQKIKHSLASSQGASIYTYAQMQKFWNMISDNSEMKGILQKVSRSFLNAKKIFFKDSYSPLGSSQTIYLDYLISPNFWKNEYTRIFGKVQYYLEKCGIVFASFLFVKFILDCLVFIIKAMHIHKITGRSLHFGKVLLAASYNILFTSIVTSIFTQDEQTEKKNKNVIRKYKPLF